MNILQLSSAHQFGGAERHVSELASQLANLGHQVYLVVRPQSPLPPLVPPSVICHELPLRGAIDLISAYRLAQFIDQHKIEVVHTHYARDYPLTAIALRLCRQKPAFFLTRHHYLPVRANWAYRRLLNNLSCAIAVSETVRKTLAQSFGWPLNLNASHSTSEQLNLTPQSSSNQTIKNSPTPLLAVIPNWIKPTEYQLSDVDQQIERTKMRTSYGLAADALVIGLINQITPAKGQALLLEAVAQLKPLPPNLMIVLAGSEHDAQQPYTQHLKQLAAKLNLTNQVKFLGHVKELRPLYAGVDLVVIPSENEAFSIVCLEAMAAQRLVIGTNIGGLAELIQDRQTGLTFPVGDSKALAAQLALAINDKTLCKTMIANAFKAVCQKFDRDKVIDKLVELYNQMRP